MTVPKVILYNKTSVIYIEDFNPFHHVIKEDESLVSDVHFPTLKYSYLSSPHPKDFCNEPNVNRDCLISSHEPQLQLL